MSWIAKTLLEIGQDWGVGTLEMGPEGVVAFEIKGDTVGIQLLDESVLIYRLRAFSASTSLSLFHMLRLGHFSHLRANVLQTGLTKDGRLCVATRIAERGFDLIAFRNAFEELSERLNAVAALA